jgi:hypothetical protein
MLRQPDEPQDRRAAAAARMLDLRPDTGSDRAVALQIIEEILIRKGEVRILRIGTATVCHAGAEADVGGDGPNVVEAVVACACDAVISQERMHERPAVEPDADDSEDASLFTW